MPIERVIVENYRSLRRTEICFQEGINIIVGNNEVGKSTLIEAINLALRCQLNRRPAAQEMHPYLINLDAVNDFIRSHKSGKPILPPRVLIEIYLQDRVELASLKGMINSRKQDTPGISLAMQLDQSHFADEYKSYVSSAESVTSIPIEYYEIVWQSFAGEFLSTRSVPIRAALIDASSTGITPSAQRYVLEVVRDYLTKDQSAKLALAYRSMREEFQSDERIVNLNDELIKKRDIISDRRLTIALDTTSRSSWEFGILPHLDNVPLSLVGKGEQSTVKIKLAIEASSNTEVILVEEPENHLSHTNLGKLTKHFSEHCGDKQVILTTHSSFVMNKLGVSSVIMFDGKHGVSMSSLPLETQLYFKRLPGHDTLRMVLAEHTVLVEGPSDELVVQKAYLQKHKRLPLELGHEIISVGTSFKRFLDIAVLLEKKVSVIADNDGKSKDKIQSYQAYSHAPNLRVSISQDDGLRTLEPQLVHSNGLTLMNKILSKSFSNEQELINYMTSNKTDVALRIFESDEDITIPDYIKNALP